MGSNLSDSTTCPFAKLSRCGAKIVSDRVSKAETTPGSAEVVVTLVLHRFRCKTNSMIRIVQNLLRSDSCKVLEAEE